MRLNCGLSLRQLALRAQTSAPTLSTYETGGHEPRLSTLHRLADAAGCDLVVELHPRLTHPERRDLEIHRAVAEKLRVDPEDIRRRALAKIVRGRLSDPDGHSAAYDDAWEGLLNGPLEALLATMISTDQAARDLRQASPFAGALADAERLEIIQRVYTGFHERARAR